MKFRVPVYNLEGRIVPMWKVPFRNVCAESFGMMLKQTFWCHVVVRLFPEAMQHDYSKGIRAAGALLNLPPCPLESEREPIRR